MTLLLVGHQTRHSLVYCLHTNIYIFVVVLLRLSGNIANAYNNDTLYISQTDCNRWLFWYTMVQEMAEFSLDCLVDSVQSIFFLFNVLLRFMILCFTLFRTNASRGPYADLRVIIMSALVLRMLLPRLKLGLPSGRPRVVNLLHFPFARLSVLIVFIFMFAFCVSFVV